MRIHLKSHFLQHSVENPFTCSTCGNTLSYKLTLVTHQCFHSKSRHFIYSNRWKICLPFHTHDVGEGRNCQSRTGRKRQTPVTQTVTMSGGSLGEGEAARTLPASQPGLSGLYPTSGAGWGGDTSSHSYVSVNPFWLGCSNIILYVLFFSH